VKKRLTGQLKLCLLTENRQNDEGWRELNKNGQSDHHNSYTQLIQILFPDGIICG
jgi:hypothetical protein